MPPLNRHVRRGAAGQAVLSRNDVSTTDLRVLPSRPIFIGMAFAAGEAGRHELRRHPVLNMC